MPWVRLDDGFWWNRKVRKAWRADPASVALYVLALTYSSASLLDGFVEEEWVAEQLPDEAVREPLVGALVEAGLWHTGAGGWNIHDFLKFNPSADEVEEQRRVRSAAGQRGAKKRWGSKSDSSGDSSGYSGGHSNSQGIGDSTSHSEPHGSSHPTHEPDSKGHSPRMPRTRPVPDPIPIRGTGRGSGGREPVSESTKRRAPSDFAGWVAEAVPDLDPGEAQTAAWTVAARGLEVTAARVRAAMGAA